MSATPPPGFDSSAGASPDPERAKLGWQRLAEAWPDELPALADVFDSFAEHQAALAHLLAISPVSADKLVRDPAALVWLAQPGIRTAGRETIRMRASLAEMGPGWPGDTALRSAHFANLRRWKQREMLRLALRDVAGAARVEQTTLELSQVAEICVHTVVDAALADATRRMGEPGAGLCLLGLGKFGGQELNYSSDIDVIFFHGGSGELASGMSRQEFFTRVAQRVIETFSAPDPGGPLFRIDVRLRPEGESGPLVLSLDGMENYYAAFGETWERMALSKARLVAGDAELGYAFFQRHQAFIYPRSVGVEMVEEVVGIKERIEREVVGLENLHRDVKLGRGGIREIEFICQSLQLLHGARHAFLQERNTLRALRGLRELDLLPSAEMDALAEADRFLRVVEHRLQIENEAQTHLLPEDAAALDRLARSLQASGLVRDAEEFMPQLDRHRISVRSIFDKVIRGASKSTAAAMARDVSFFPEPARAARDLAELGGQGSGSISPRSKKLFARLEPLLLAQLREVAEPEAALARMVRFAERYGLRGALFETLLTNPRVLDLLIRLFDASPFLSEIAVRRPQLVEEVARLGDLGRAMHREQYLTELACNEEGLAWRNWVRAYRRAQQLRIGLRDLLGLAELEEVWAEGSALAEACLLFTQREIREVDSLTVIGLGKFGGRELGYGADLDLLFIGDDPEAAARLVGALTEQTAEGRLFPVDVRLRPEGEKGQLAVALGEWEDYFSRGRGHLWEVQALTKARTLSGPRQIEWLTSAQRIWKEHGQREDLFAGVAEMLRRVQEHRGADAVLDFKTGPGGLMQLEFFVQARQMQAGLWEPNTLAALERLGVPHGRELAEAYRTIRKVETVLRRAEDTSVSSLPADPAAQERLAKRCGLAARAELLEMMAHARRVIGERAVLAE